MKEKKEKTKMYDAYSLGLIKNSNKEVKEEVNEVEDEKRTGEKIGAIGVCIDLVADYLAYLNNKIDRNTEQLNIIDRRLNVLEGMSIGFLIIITLVILFIS